MGSVNSLTKILQITRSDQRGGAAKIAWSLHSYFLQQGLDAKMLVDIKSSQDSNVIGIPLEGELSKWVGFWQIYQDYLRQMNHKWRGLWQLSNLLNWIKQPKATFENNLGIQRGSKKRTEFISNQITQGFQVVQGHILHGGYFDLGLLPYLSQSTLLFLTLHDAWLFTGHCAHSFECERWKSGCGQCPDLSIPLLVKRDATNINWRYKQEIYKKSKFYVITPCHWLMEKTKKSILAEGIIDTKVIPNGISLSVFKPLNKLLAREKLGLPKDTKVVLFSANGIIQKRWKNFPLLRATLVDLSSRIEQSVLVICLGQNAADEFIGNIRIHFIPYVEDINRVALYYQASDIYLHPSKVDTFPTSILEALGCGIPVIATNVGGIPEQVKSLYSTKLSGAYGEEEATGILVEDGDVESLCSALFELLREDSVRLRLAENAHRDAQTRFDVLRMASDYFSWYEEKMNENARSLP